MTQVEMEMGFTEVTLSSTVNRGTCRNETEGYRRNSDGTDEGSGSDTDT